MRLLKKRKDDRDIFFHFDKIDMFPSGIFRYQNRISRRHSRVCLLWNRLLFVMTRLLMTRKKLQTFSDDLG
jgi:hypothetical protein